VGFAFFMVGFLTYFIVLFGFPFGSFRGTGTSSSSLLLSSLELSDTPVYEP